MQFGTYAPPAYGEGDTFKPSEHVGSPLIIKVHEVKHIETTRFKPEGGDGVVLSLVDLSDGETYRDVLWMNGALVDGLRGYAGQAPVVITLQYVPGKNGNSYITAQPATEAEMALAQSYVTAKGDPFAPVLGTVTPATPAPQQAAAPAATAPVAAADARPPWER